MGPMTKAHHVDLNLLAAFAALDEARTVTGAAATLGITQPGMSRMLARLRLLFNDALFVRVGAVLMPTPRAEDLRAPVREVLQFVEARVLSDARFDPRSDARTVRIATVDTVQALMLPPLLDRLARDAPLLRVHCGPLRVDDASALVRGEIDVELSLLPQDRTDLFTARLCNDRFVCVARQGHPGVVGGAISLDAWLELRHIVATARGEPLTYVEAVLGSRGLARHDVVRVQSFLVAMHLVAGSDRVTTVPSLLATSFARQHGLQVVPAPIELPNFDLMMTWHERTHADPGLRWFRHCVSEVTREVAARWSGSG